MNKIISHTIPAPVDSEGCGEEQVIFFAFESDFVEANLRCIPMIVRFKLDACGIKLKLGEWSKMSLAERDQLATLPVATIAAREAYKALLRTLVYQHTGSMPADLPVEVAPLWAHTTALPLLLLHKLKEFNWQLSLRQWQQLSRLQRFALLKLCRPGHENKNFPKAVKEFGLI